MAKLILQDTIMNAIKTDPVLFGLVMSELKTTPTYGLQLLYTNSPKLTQAGVLNIIKDYMGGGKDMELLQEMQEA